MFSRYSGFRACLFRSCRGCKLAISVIIGWFVRRCRVWWRGIAGPVEQAAQELLRGVFGLRLCRLALVCRLFGSAVAAQSERIEQGIAHGFLRCRGCAARAAERVSDGAGEQGLTDGLGVDANRDIIEAAANADRHSNALQVTIAALALDRGDGPRL